MCLNSIFHWLHKIITNDSDHPLLCNQVQESTRDALVDTQVFNGHKITSNRNKVLSTWTLSFT